MTPCREPLETAVHPVLANRHSPTRFDTATSVSFAQVDTLLDAARLAPSAGNSQPWRFVVGRRGDAVHRRIVPHLAASAAEWAGAAGLLVVNIAHIHVEGTLDWEYSEFSRYDLGQAVAHMTIQGLTMGLAAHQFRAFDRAAVTAEFAVPTHWEVCSMTAIGATAPAVAETPRTDRARRSRSEITWVRDGAACAPDGG